MKIKDVMAKIHIKSDVASKRIGQRTNIWQYVVVLPGAIIGDDVNICAHCFIENDVKIGNRVTIKSGVYLWDGIEIQDDVFVGPNATFSNDKFPRSKANQKSPLRTLLENNASIGAGSVILPGLTIGAYAMVGAGSVVTKSVPPLAIVKGSPARITGYIDAKATENNLASNFQAPVELPLESSILPLGPRNVTFHLLKCVSDIRGSLSVGEFNKEIPFVPNRYFLVFDVPSIETRGAHAHYKCHQFLICVSGSCAVVADDGFNRAEILLDSPNKGLYLPPLTWGIQYKYSTNAVLLVFASDAYDPGDYIRSYSTFREIVEKL